MKIFTAAQMRAFDAAATSEYSLSPAVLMENAALRVVEFLEKQCAPLQEKRITIFCGKGNNGGDGLAIARHLLGSGARLSLVLAASPDDYKNESQSNWEALHRALEVAPDALRVLRLPEKPRWNAELKALAEETDIALDALLGTGFQGEVRGGALRFALEILNATRGQKIAVDLPSGVNADTGEAGERAPHCDFTITFAAPKRGLFVRDGLEKCGEIWVGSIGSAPQQMLSTHTGMQAITRNEVAAMLPRRTLDAHKGDAGKVAICGGSFGMSGAITLSAKAALASGAGLCSALLPETILPMFAASCLEATSHALPCTESGTLSEAAVELALQKIENADALALGPGLSREESAMNFARELLLRSSVPAVVDADALHALPIIEKKLKKRAAPLVLTPHPGEMGALLNLSTQQVQADRFAAATQCAKRYNAMVVLKGARSLVAHPQGEIRVNITGNAGMATGGSGDTLTGLLAGLLAQTRDALTATLCAVHAHGAAGDRAYQRHGYGLVAGDIAAHIAPVLHDLRAAKIENENARLFPLR